SLISLAVEGAFLDFKIAGVCDGFGNVKQQKVVEKHIGVCGERRWCPIPLAVVHIVGRQAVLQALEEKRAKLVGNRKWGLLIPQIAKIIHISEKRAIQTNIGLFRAANPIDAWRLRSDKRAEAR